jgi:hypothetical protein
MKKIGLMVILLLCVVVYGCKDVQTSKEETKKTNKKIDIEKLLAETNIAVLDNNNDLYGGRDNWTIKQIDKTEVIKNTKRRKFIPSGDLLYKVWYGQDDLTTLTKAIEEGIKQGLSKISKVSNLDKILKNTDPIKLSEQPPGKIDYFSGKEDISHRTIKVMSYAFMGAEYNPIPFGYWKHFVNQSTDSKIIVEQKNGEWIVTGNKKTNKNTIMTRTKSSFQYANGQKIKKFSGIKSPKVSSGRQVASTLRELTWDVYMVLDGKEPEFYPEYAKALVRSFELEEEKHYDKLIDAVKDYVQKEEVKDYLQELKWGMSIEEVVASVPNTELKENNGNKYLTLNENRYASTSCIEGDTVFFNFVENKLDNIRYSVNMNPKCNIDDPSVNSLVKEGYKELYEQVIREYDPGNKDIPSDLGTRQEWSNENSKFVLAFWVALDINPPEPYAEFSITRNKDGAPVVLIGESVETEPTENKNQNNSSSSKKWDGKWSWSDNHNGRLLEIQEQSKGTFDFELMTNSGARVRMLDGVAQFTDNHKAKYVDKEYGCEITFIHNDDNIEVTANEECNQYTMDGTPFGGAYPKDGETVTNDLASLEVLPPAINDNLKKITGENYEKFITNFETVSDDEDLDGFGATVITGFVKGAASLNGIIMYRENGDVWAAYHEGGDVIYYFTNVPDSKSEVPLTIHRYYKNKNQIIGVRYMSE